MTKKQLNKAQEIISANNKINAVIDSVETTLNELSQDIYKEPRATDVVVKFEKFIASAREEADKKFLEELEAI